MISGTYVRVDPEALALHALAGGRQSCPLRADAALTGKLAFAVSDDDLEAFLPGLHRFAQRLHDVGDAIRPHSLDPADAEALHRPLDVDTLAAAFFLRRARWQV